MGQIGEDLGMVGKDEGHRDRLVGIDEVGQAVFDAAPDFRVEGMGVLEHGPLDVDQGRAIARRRLSANLFGGTGRGSTREAKIPYDDNVVRSTAHPTRTPQLLTRH